MKQKLFTLLTLLVVAVTGAWATTATFEGTNLNVASEPKTVGAITLSTTNMTYQNGLYASGASKTFTLTASETTISQVLITMSGTNSRYQASNITNCTSCTLNGSVYTCTFSTPQTTISFTNNGGGVTITKLEVTYGSGEEPSGDEGNNVTASWLAPSNSMNLNGSSSDEDGLTANTATLSSALKFVSTWSKNDTYYYTVDRNDNEQDTKGSINENRYIDFTAAVPTGVTFTLSKVQAVGVGAGTGNNSFRVDFVDDEGATTLRAAATVGSGAESQLDYTFSTPREYTEGTTIKVRIYVGINNTDDTRNVGFRDVKLIGTYENNDAPNSAPSITVQPTNAETYVGVATNLSVTVTGKPTPEYQWYSCDDSEKTNAQEIENATTRTYSFTPDAEGTYYFYVVATNSEGSATSNVVSVVATAEPPADPEFKVYGNTVQITCDTDGATIYYEMGNSDVKNSASKVEYTGAFIPVASGTVYAYAVKNDLESNVVSKAVTLSIVGDIVGAKLITLQPDSKPSSDTNYDNKTYSNNGFTLVSTANLANSGRGIYTNHFKSSGTITVTAPEGSTIQSIKIYGTSNDGSKVSTITAGEGSTVVSTPAELMPRDVVVSGVQTMSEIVITVDEPTTNNSLSFSLGRESRFYVEVYGATSVSATIASSGYTSIASAYPLDFANAEDGESNKNLTAYVISSITSDAVTLTSVESAPAETGLILKGTASTAYTIPTTATPAAIASNELSAAVTATDVEASTVYVVSGGVLKLFAGTQIPAGKAYLLKSKVDEVGGANSLSFIFDDNDDYTTGIENVNNERTILKGDFYNLAGQRVDKPTKGIYIVNGRKVIVK